MTIYDKYGNMADSDVAAKVELAAKKVEELFINLIAAGTPILELRSLMSYVSSMISCRLTLVICEEQCRLAEENNTEGRD